MKRDLAVIGAGPAGTAAAIAREKGAQVSEVDGAEVRRAAGYLDEPLGF